jgi:hypothetical protein
MAKCFLSLSKLGNGDPLQRAVPDQAKVRLLRRLRLRTPGKPQFWWRRRRCVMSKHQRLASKVSEKRVPKCTR